MTDVRSVFFRLFSLTLALTSIVHGTPRLQAQEQSEHADADDADKAAREAFEAGRAAYDRGAFAEALGLFERAYALSARPELLYNIGRAADFDGQRARAIDGYTAYLNAAPNTERREYVQTRLDKLRAAAQTDEAAHVPADDTGAVPEVVALAPPDQPRAGRLTIDTKPTASSITLDGRPIGVAASGDGISLSEGEHEIEAQAVGYLPEKRRVRVTVGTTETVTILFAKPAPAAQHSERSHWAKSPWLWTAVGAVVAGATVGTILATRGSTDVHDEPSGGSAGTVLFGPNKP